MAAEINFWLRLYATMVRIRKVEEKIAEIYPLLPRRIQCPVHLCVGEEAIAAGVCANLAPGDYVFSFYRSHGHYLAKGGNLKALMAELYGKATGCSKGIGGSMHLIDRNAGFMGASAIVGGQIPLAVGAAFAVKMRKENKVTVVFFGDGACEEGVWHESMNFAALKKLPILFVCENNSYAGKSHISARQAKDNIYKRAGNYGIKGMRINGNNILEVSAASGDALINCRKGCGPVFIEARTYRWRGHLEDTFFNKDILEGRPEAEVEQWKKKCPIRFFECFLKRQGCREDDFRRISDGINREVEEAVRFAEESPFPGVVQREDK